MFGSQYGAPDLSQVTAMPGIDMSQLRSMEDMAVSSSFPLPGRPDYLAMLSGISGVGGQQQPQSMMPSAPAPQLQAGGEQFNPFYTQAQYQPRQTAQALSGLLGGIYGTV